ncbi:MAG: hypothetical protein KJN80_07120 [Deltaproteobacteria bacterium]|nr:hypothetical protein [Deltaproteobacteria bacterium]NNK86237.1 hypothetical protein [Desulfobacterales bacterium]
MTNSGSHLDYMMKRVQGIEGPGVFVFSVLLEPLTHDLSNPDLTLHLDLK